MPTLAALVPTRRLDQLRTCLQSCALTQRRLATQSVDQRLRYKRLIPGGTKGVSELHKVSK